MKQEYAKYISREYLQHVQHSFDTQVNEGINNSVASYANKGKHYSGTSSLITRVLIAAGIHLVGYHHFWTSCFDLLEVNIPTPLHLHLLALDKEKVSRYHHDHDFKNKVKRKRSEHEKFAKEYLVHQKDVNRNATYQSHTGCADEPSANTCKHSKFGCKGDKKHKTERSVHCDFHCDKRGGLSLADSLRRWSDANSSVVFFDEQKSGKKKPFLFCLFYRTKYTYII